VRFLGADFWDGDQDQVDLYQELAEIGFPVLMNADGLGAPDQYNCGYHYVFVIDHNGIVQYRGGANMPAIELVMQEAVSRLPSGVGVGDDVPAAASLEAAYPNPFNPQTTIPVQVGPAASGRALQLEILDVRGRVVRTLLAGPRAAGRHEIVFDGRNQRGERLPSGVYLARLRAGGSEQTRLLTLVK
jgi:hypothetical protein